MEEFMEMDIALTSQEEETTEATEAIPLATVAQETQETIIQEEGVTVTWAQEVTTEAWGQELVTEWVEEMDTILVEQMGTITAPETLTWTETMENQEDPVWAEVDSAVQVQVEEVLVDLV